MPRRKYEDDDGRTIAGMNIPGMTRDRNRMPNQPPHPAPSETAGDRREPLDARSTRRAALYAGLAGLCIAACFLGAFALFILFCTRVWF